MFHVEHRWTSGLGGLDLDQGPRPIAIDVRGAFNGRGRDGQHEDPPAWPDQPTSQGQPLVWRERRA